MLLLDTPLIDIHQIIRIKMKKIIKMPRPHKHLTVFPEVIVYLQQILNRMVLQSLSRVVDIV